MYYFNPSVKINLDWRIMKGLGKDPEDFYGSDVKLFLCGKCNVFPLPIDLTRGDGHIIAKIPAGMPEDVYGVHLLWSKNDKSGFGRCMMRTERHDIFCLDSSVETRNNATIEIQSTAASYGYDGLSAYELAVLLGKTSLDRNQWVENAAEANANVEELRREVERINISEHALYKEDYDLADTTLSEEIDAEEQEYRDGRWWFRGAVRIAVPHKGDYMLRLFGTEGSADIRVGDNYYAPGGDINIGLQDVSEIAFETKDWLSMDRIITVEDGIIKLPTKLSELENDIIGVDTRQHMIYLVARDESIQV